MIIVFLFLNMIPALFTVRFIAQKRLQPEIPKSKNRRSYGIQSSFSQFMKKQGCEDEKDVFFYTVTPMGGVLLGIFFAANGNFSAAMVFFIMPILIAASMLKIKKKNKQSGFQKNAYKLYKYILNQITAGVKPCEALKSMYQVVEDKELKCILVDACAKYAVSMNEDILAQEIIQNINTPEAISFAQSIKDRLFESRDHKLLERLEQLMFNRYFAYVQRMTDGVRSKCFVAVLILCVVIVVMILIPTFIDVGNAIDSIFI